MAEEKINEQQDEQLELGSVLTRTEQFIEDNQKNVMIGVGVVIALILLFIMYRKFYIGPKEEEAQSQMFVAEQNFERDSFRLALRGDGVNPGFIDIADDYSMTKAGKLASYYAGICYLHIGEFENAIDYLKKFNGKDHIVAPLALGAIGDAYMELDNTDEAVRYYKKAAEKNKNTYTTPMFMMKMAGGYEKLGDYSQALKYYEKIKEEYPESQEGKVVDKNIAFCKMKLGKE